MDGNQFQNVPQTTPKKYLNSIKCKCNIVSTDSALNVYHHLIGSWSNQIHSSTSITISSSITSASRSDRLSTSIQHQPTRSSYRRFCCRRCRFVLVSNPIDHNRPHPQASYFQRTRTLITVVYDDDVMSTIFINSEKEQAKEISPNDDDDQQQLRVLSVD